jgi:hypothetical protein
LRLQAADSSWEKVVLPHPGVPVTRTLGALRVAAEGNAASPIVQWKVLLIKIPKVSLPKCLSKLQTKHGLQFF